MVRYTSYLSEKLVCYILRIILKYNKEANFLPEQLFDNLKANVWFNSNQAIACQRMHQTFYYFALFSFHVIFNTYPYLTILFIILINTFFVKARQGWNNSNNPLYYKKDIKQRLVDSTGIPWRYCRFRFRCSQKSECHNKAISTLFIINVVVSQ